MLNDADFNFFEKYQVTVAPELPKENLDSLENIVHNPFLYLERNDRFLKCEFIRFPDEQRQLTYQDKHYFCFGKDAHNDTYFVIGQDDGVVYEFRKDVVIGEANKPNEYLVILPTNNNIANFATSYHYFLMAIYQLLAQIRATKFDDYDDEVAIYEKIADEFKENIQKIDNYAFADYDDNCTYWGMVYNMLVEADLAFYLPSVSLFDYMNTERY